MPIALTYDEVKALDPCEDDFHRVAKLLGGKTGWNGHKINAATARKAGCTFDDIVWVASETARKDANIARRLQLWAADCATRVLHVYEHTEKSDAPRNAIIAARRFARGKIDEIGLAAAQAAAWDAVWAFGYDEASCARLAALAARDAAGRAGDVWCAQSAAQFAQSSALGNEQDAAWDAERASVQAARAAEQDWQFDRLIAWLSDDEPEDWPLPERAIKEVV